jgi:hypothetical protein
MLHAVQDMYDRIGARLDRPSMNRFTLYDCVCILLLLNGRLNRALNTDAALFARLGAQRPQLQNRLRDINADLLSLQHVGDGSSIDSVRAQVISAHQQSAAILQLLRSHVE